MRHYFGDQPEFERGFRVVNFGQQRHLERAIQSHETGKQVRAALVAKQRKL